MEQKTMAIGAAAVTIGVLIAIVVVSLGGFGPLFSDNGSTDDSGPTERQLALNKTVQVNQGGLSFVQFATEKKGIYTIDVQNELNATHDVILSSNVSKTYSGDNSATLSEYSEEDVSQYNETIDLDGGTHYLVIDNTADDSQPSSVAPNTPNTTEEPMAFDANIKIYTQIKNNAGSE